MTAGQPVEPGPVEMIGPEQIDPLALRLYGGALRFGDLQEGEGGAAAVEAVANQRHRAGDAWHDLAVHRRDLARDGLAVRDQPVDLAPPLHPRQRDLRFGGQVLGLRTIDIALVELTPAQRIDPPTTTERSLPLPI